MIKLTLTLLAALAGIGLIAYRADAHNWPWLVMKVGDDRYLGYDLSGGP